MPTVRSNHESDAGDERRLAEAAKPHRNLHMLMLGRRMSPCSGRSEGTAHIVYVHPSDAKEAIKQYNGVKV